MLGMLALVDTGVVAHQPGGSREHLISDTPGRGCVPYADAKEFFRGTTVAVLSAQSHASREKPKNV